MRTLLIFGGLVILVIIVLSQTLYVVDVKEQVIITRFGEVREVHKTAGIRAKVPFVESVVRFDRRLLRIDADAEAMRDEEKQDLTIDSYARYRINDPVQFRKTLLTPDNARSRLGDIVNSTLRERIALLPRIKIIGAKPQLDDEGNEREDEEGLRLVEGTESRTELLGEVLEGVRLRVLAREQNLNQEIPDLEGAVSFALRIDDDILDRDNTDRDNNLNTGITLTDIRVINGPDGGNTEGIDVVIDDFDSEGNVATFTTQEGETLTPGEGFTIQYFVERDDPFGIDIVDVRIKRADFPDSVTPSIYTRMRAERNRIATRFRAEGDQEDLEIRASANKDRDIILAEADRRSNEIRGEGEARAIEILADALEQDPEFFAFRRSLQAYRQFLTQGTTIVLSADSELFNFLASPGGMQPGS
jgi:regulator of protease activity HflC (stomatin/prohibitin superfamily)